MKKLLILSFLCLGSVLAHAGKVAITIDDLRSTTEGRLSAQARTDMILKTLKESNTKAALFVCGMRVDSKEGKKLIRQWDQEGHIIANHSYSHLYYNSPEVSYQEFREDFLKGESIIKEFSGFTKLFRFPYLKEGNSLSKRDQFRDILKANGYRNGYVTIDASDWYIEQRMLAKISVQPDFDLTAYKNYFLEHIWERTLYYDELAKKVLGQEITHTLLLHDNMLNALFLDDLINMYRQNEWEIVDADIAYTDAVYAQAPEIVPAGESIIWALAKETGKYEDELRYPAEDGQYEKPKMDKLGL